MSLSAPAALRHIASHACEKGWPGEHRRCFERSPLRTDWCWPCYARDALTKTRAVVKPEAQRAAAP